MTSDGEGLDWQSVQYFLRAAQSRSLSGAARSLRVEHTTVGRRLSQLERSVGAPLVDRGPSGLSLTAVGERVFQLAVEMDRVARSIGELALLERSHVRLVLPTGFSTLLTPRLEELQRHHPQILLEVVSAARHVDLRKGEADLAIRIGEVQDEALISRKLGDVGSALYASRKYLARRTAPIDPNDLAGHSVIGFHSSLAQTPPAQWLAARTQRATIVMRSREAVDMVSAAQNGVGLAVLPCFLADPDASLVRLTALPVAVRRVGLVYRREARLSPETRAVIHFVIDVMRAHVARLRGNGPRAPLDPLLPRSAKTKT